MKQGWVIAGRTGSAVLLVGALLAAQAATAADIASGQRLFVRKCALCHASGGTGSLMLERRLGPERAVLAERTDLQPAYIGAIVRTGLNSMPALTRVEVTDAQLDDVAAYLTRPRPATATGATP